MANQVLLDEFKDLIETITLAIMEDIKSSKLAEDMVVQTVNLQVEAAAKKYQAIANESMRDLEVVKKDILAEIERKVGQEVRATLTNSFKVHAESLSEKIEETKSAQEKLMESTNRIAVVQEEQSEVLEKMSQIQGEQSHLQTEMSNFMKAQQEEQLRLIKEMMKEQEKARLQDLAAREEEKLMHDKRFKITVGMQAASIILCLAVLVVLVMNHGI